MKTKGKFITFEGSEGVGKSTQMKLLKEYCEQNGINAVFTREPGGTPVAEKIRAVILDPENSELDMLSELFLYEAARRQHILRLIEPALERGQTVFCDRFTDSSLAYQAYGRGLDKETVKALNEITIGKLNIDCTVFLKLDPIEGFNRKGGADKTDRLEKENIDFFKRVYEGFNEIAKSEPQRVVVVDACGTKEQTHQSIIKALIERNIF